MPFIFSERLPVPTLKSYVCISLLIFAASAVYWQKGVSEEPELATSSATKSGIPSSSPSSAGLESGKYANEEHSYKNLLDRVISEPFLLWVRIFLFFLYIQE